VLHHRRPPQLWRSGTLLKKKSRHVDAFVTFSQFCANKHQEFGFHRDLSLVRPFLPDNETGAESTTEEISGEPPFFLFVGRLEIIKGLQDVIPLFDGKGAAELWIAGTGTYEPTLRALATNRPGVRFLGQQSSAQLRNLYRRAIAVVLPSMCYEVFPMVVLEAFREGTPIVARRLGPFPEIVAESNGGLLFDTPKELQRALSRLQTDSGLRDTLSRAGRDAFETNWREDVAMKNYFDLIQRLARKRQATGVLRKLSVPN
jgi:glycosyltransferase involved in cell wall biosynthesis